MSCLCSWLLNVQAKWKKLCGEEVSLFGDIAKCRLDADPLFLDDDLCSRLFVVDCDPAETWEEVGLRELGVSVWPACVQKSAAPERPSVMMLPPELWQMVGKEASLKDLLSLSSVCHETRNALFDFAFEKALEASFPNSLQWRRASKDGSVASKLGWHGVPCALLSNDVVVHQTRQNWHDWMLRMRLWRQSLLKSGPASGCVTLLPNCSTAVRCGWNIVSGELQTGNLLMFSEGRRSLTVPSEESMLLAANHRFVCSFGKTALHVFDESLSIVHKLSHIGESAFSADVNKSLLAFACGPDLSLVDLERGKVMFGRQPVEESSSPKLQKPQQVPPSVSSAKYVAAAAPEPEQEDEAFLEMGRFAECLFCYFFWLKGDFFLVALVWAAAPLCFFRSL